MTANYSRGSQTKGRQTSAASADQSVRTELARYRRENTELRQRVQKIEQEKVTQARYSRLSDLSREYAMDLDEEVADTMALNDQQFERYCEKIVARYSKLPTANDGRPLYAPELPAARNKGHDPMKYSREAQDLMNAKGITYAEAAKQIREKHNVPSEVSF